MELIFPKRLKSDSVIGIFSPSEALGGDRIERMEKGLSVLRSAGLEYVFAPNALELSMETSAGSIDQRIEDLEYLLHHESVDLLLGSWGGKSANQLLPHLPYELLKQKKKAMAGFSDVAVLLNAVTSVTGLVTYHGPNVAGKLHESQYGNLSQATEGFDWKDFNFLGLADAIIVNSGEARGRIFGGNLNCFTLGLVTSDFDLNIFEGGIFFFEDLGLPPRVLEQYLVSLRNRGFFDAVSGIVIGQIDTDPDNDWMNTTTLDVIRRTLTSFAGPIVASPFFGHADLPNPIIPIGAMSSLSTAGLSWVVTEPDL